MASVRAKDIFLNPNFDFFFFFQCLFCHRYYFSGRNATVEEFLNTSIFDVLKREILDVKNVVANNTDTSFPIWMSKYPHIIEVGEERTFVFHFFSADAAAETASAFGGGSPLLSNRFVSGFIWLDKLGMAASNNISVVIRQSFIGGNYGLVDCRSLSPTPVSPSLYHVKKLTG